MEGREGSNGELPTAASFQPSTRHIMRLMPVFARSGPFATKAPQLNDLHVSSKKRGGGLAVAHAVSDGKVFTGLHGEGPSHRV